jgi:GTPase SAR1 family protein
MEQQLNTISEIQVAKNVSTVWQTFTILMRLLLLTYDITNEKTFESINYWIEELRSKCDQDKLILYLAANKCDVDSKDKKVSSTMGNGI